MYSHLFSPLEVGGKRLVNRITMAPMYLGYAGEGGTVSTLMLEHYRQMGQSGASLVTVENASVEHLRGSGSERTLRLDTEENLAGLSELAERIKEGGALAGIQINHAGRYAGVSEPVAPSAVDTFGRTPRPLTLMEIAEIRDKFADAADRAKRAGFDMVELHGGTGYLLAQFLSPSTNLRTDEYGGSPKNRMRFPLEVLDAVKSRVGPNFPVGCRFLADDWMPGGLGLEESKPAAQELSRAGVAYLSVMGGIYESFSREEIVERTKSPGYMADLAGEIREAVSCPVIAAGRISTGRLAEDILTEGKADLVGLARGLWADPEWPLKVREGREEEIIHCDPECGDVCMQLVMQGKPAFCPQWPSDKTRRLKDLFQ